MWWLWVVGGLALWLVLGALLAVLVGRAIRIADERSPGTGVLPRTGDVHVAAGAARRGWVPLPPVGLALVACVLALETGGYVLRLIGSRGELADVLSMDAPWSVPRAFVAALFATAAVAAVAGAAVQQGRRTWWLAVAAVGAGIATVTAGGTVHADALSRVGRLIGPSAALVSSALVAAGVLCALWFLSRRERRDRRRVLGALCGYAVVVVGLSAIGSHAGGVSGGSWTAAGIFVVESARGLAGVAFLMAVLVGVAPRLVLPRDWVLRREADDHAAGQPAGQPVPTPRGRPS